MLRFKNSKMRTLNCSIIVAKSKNHVIGKDNKLPWNLPSDLRYFKDKTSSHPVIMGKNTYLSIGKPLKNRINIVVSSTLKPEDGIIVAKSLHDAVLIAYGYNDNVFIIGGDSIYRQALDMDCVKTLLISDIDIDVDGDSFFPPVDENIWKLSANTFCDDDKHNINFKKYDRI